MTRERESRRRAGFTLIELLVVIAIIAILIGLLLPAVQKVREAAARGQCQNNIKQICLAVHAYHDANGFIPTNGPQATYNSAGQNWSWETRILPYIEQQTLFQLLNISVNTLAQAQPAGGTATIGLPIKTYLCPSTNASNGVARTNCADIGNVNNLGVGNTCYKGVCGDNWPAANGGSFTNAFPSTANNGGLDNGNGIFYRSDGVPTTPGHGPIKITAITDGTSCTFMVGEDIPDLNQWCAWPYANAVTGTCAIPLNNATQPGQPGFGLTNNWPNIYSFRSRHSHGGNFGMADGSVQFVTDDINLTTYEQLATYNGAEPASLP